MTKVGPIVLYVDDDDANRQLMNRIFARLRADHQLVCAVSASEALERAREQRPDLVLLDLTLKEGSGEELLGRIKSEYGIPVIIVSGHTDDATSGRLLDQGADAYMTKPMDVVNLLAAIDELLEAGEAP